MDDKYMYNYSDVKRELKELDDKYMYTYYEMKEKETELREMNEKIESVVAYLALSKFSEESWVSKYDILRLLGRY